MKTLQHFIQHKMTNLYEETGAFFAFSQKQFKEKQKEGVQYISLGSGLIVEKQHLKKLLGEQEKIYADGVQEDLLENGKLGIIKRELANHECYYNYDEVSEVVDILADYGITEAEIWNVLHNNCLAA